MQNVTPRSALAALALGLLFVLLLAPASLADAPEKEVSPDAKGKAYTWEASNGMRYEYFVPKDYDHEKGASLTLILHGSNLDRRWGFANHEAGSFRAHDIVVSPDGTTSNGNGGFNSMQSSAELARLNVLHKELKEIFNIKATYLYGHSQGSFFSFYYAGAYPDEVQGLVGQASGVWIGTEANKKMHHQAVVLMHGTKDPVVSYSLSVGGLEFYQDAKYPMARLRSLDGWNHWPNQNQTEQQLAWCEGMTTSDAEALERCFEVLDEAKEWRDPVALYQVAARASSFEGVSGKVQKAAQKAMGAMEKLAAQHVSSIEKSMGKNKGTKLEDDAWVGHIPIFLRHFRGIPACDEFAKKLAKTIKKHEEQANKLGREYWRLKEKKPLEAFEMGVEQIKTAFLWHSTSNPDRLSQLEKWREDAKGLKIKKSLQKEYDEVVGSYVSSLEKGKKAFEKVDRAFK